MLGLKEDNQTTKSLSWKTMHPESSNNHVYIGNGWVTLLYYATNAVFALSEMRQYETIYVNGYEGSKDENAMLGQIMDFIINIDYYWNPKSLSRRLANKPNSVRTLSKYCKMKSR